MLQRYQGIIPDGVALAAARVVARFFPLAGILQRVELAVNAANAGGVTTFDVRKNGVTIYALVGDRPSIASGQRSVEQAGLNVATALGDVIEVFLTVWPVGGLVGPGMVQIAVEDGVPAGLDSAAVLALATGGDLVGSLGSPTVKAIRGFLIKDFGTSGPTISDDFADGIFDTTLWTRSNISNVVETNSRIEMYTSGAVDFFQWAVTRDMTNRYAQFKNGPNNTGQTWIRMLLNGGLDYLEIRIDPAGAGFKAGYHVNGGGDTWVVNRAYSPTNDQWLKFQHQTSDGKWHFFNSPDGVTWTDIGNCSPPSGAGQSASRFLALSLTASVGTPVWIDSFQTNIPQASTNLSDGDTLVYRSSNTQFENFPVGAVPGVSGAPSGPPANAKPGQCPIVYDMVNHRIYVWNPNTSAWDWRAINNS